jgi:ABC-type multidrug transport system ATPase subunit
MFRGSLRHNLALTDHHSQRLTDVAAQFGLSDRLDQRASELSHGLKQRAALARAILARPTLLLLDEPEGGLDQSSLSAWQSFAARTAADRSCTLVVAAHRPAGLEGLPVSEIKLG